MVTGWGRSTWGDAVSSTGTLGDESVSCAANVSVTTVVGTSALGTVIPVSNNNLDVTGLAGTSALGSVTTTADSDNPVIGFGLTGSVSSVLVWGQVAQNVTTTYTPVSTTQSPDWQEVA